ncbi:MAG TPA: class I SAM-dependent methyltransferase, partial [candidate division Zixibacteria bacterium]|nr:class I SAM-dependent methyltransferase [candidate division Zixibacteria bacterium]
NGFYIFLNPNEIDSSDEYNENDPYTVIENFKSDFHQRRLNCTIELIKKSKSSKNLLDLGCGQGHFTDKIKKEFSNYNVFGLDYSISAIEYADTNFKNIDFVVANAYNPPYCDEYFDIIILNNIWEHVPDPLNLLQSINRIIKPNGQLVISTPSRYRFINLIKASLGKEISFMSKLHVTEYTVGQIKEQLKFGGYKVNKVYSPSIKEGRLIYRVLKSIISIILKTVKSHHILEATVFYSANKLPPTKAHK